MSGIAICLLSYSREALVSSSIQETPREASHNGSQEGSCIPVNLPLSLLELHFISSGVFYFVLDKGEGEGRREYGRGVYLFARHSDIIGSVIVLTLVHIGNRGL